MFQYCLNNPVMYEDTLGTEPTSSIDTDGDGEDDCYVYEYHFTIIIYHPESFEIINASGFVYIYTGKTRSDMDGMSYPEGFNPGTDLLVADLTHETNPTMYAYQAQKVSGSLHKLIAECLIQYDTDFDTSWQRTSSSLVTEWKAHNIFAPFDSSAQNVDFDNAEEGKKTGYYFKKAFDRGWNKYIMPLLS